MEQRVNDHSTRSNDTSISFGDILHFERRGSVGVVTLDADAAGDLAGTPTGFELEISSTRTHYASEQVQQRLAAF